MFGTALRPATTGGGANAHHIPDMSLLMMSGDSPIGRAIPPSPASVSSHLHHGFPACFSPFVQGEAREAQNGTVIVPKAVATVWKRRKALGVRRFAGFRPPEKIALAQQNLKELRQIMVGCVYESY